MLGQLVPQLLLASVVVGLNLDRSGGWLGVLMTSFPEMIARDGNLFGGILTHTPSF